MKTLKMSCNVRLRLLHFSELENSLQKANQIEEKQSEFLHPSADAAEYSKGMIKWEVVAFNLKKPQIESNIAAYIFFRMFDTN